MQKSKARDLVTASLLGVIAGMRSMLAPAVVTRSLGQTRFVTVGAHDNIRRLTTAAALLELLGDKASFIPARTATVSFVGRVLSGGFSAFYATHGQIRHRATAAVLAMASAALSTHALFRARRYASYELGIPNATAGVIEDTLALAAARFATHRLTLIGSAAPAPKK